MTPDRKYGKTAPAPVTILPASEIDMSDGKPLPANLGKTEVPVTVIEGPTLDFGPEMFHGAAEPLRQTPLALGAGL
jgi:hypothetical protein